MQKLGSVDLSVPAAYSMTGVLTSRGTATIVGNTVKLRSLNLAFLHWFTVKVTATAACSPSTGNVWSAAGQDRSRLHRIVVPAGHAAELSDDGRDGRLLARVHHGRQPADTGPDATISSVTSDPGGPPLQVGTYDGANNLITGGSPVSISMAIDQQPRRRRPLPGHRR